MYNSGANKKDIGVSLMYKKLREQPPAPLDDSTRHIPLTQGKFAVVDTADFEWLSQWNWYADFDAKSSKWYAGRTVNHNKKFTHVAMHRVILNAPKGFEVDHKDNDGLNNRRTNLRIATRQQNTFNRRTRGEQLSKFKGVTRHSHSQRWVARIGVNRVRVYLGCFDIQEDAARAYDAAALENFGEFAVLNFPRQTT